MMEGCGSCLKDLTTFISFHLDGRAISELNQTNWRLPDPKRSNSAQVEWILTTIEHEQQ